MKNLLLALTTFVEIIQVSAIPSAVTSRNTQICGKAGYDAGTESFWGSTVSSYAACYKACTKQKQCQSFAYGNGGDCELYACTVKSNFVAVSNSPYLFYDAGCASSSTSTTTTTTTKPTTTTKSTTTTTKTTTTTTTTVTKATTSKATTTTTKTNAKTTSTTTTTTSASAASTSTSSGLICGQPGYVAGSAPFYEDSTGYDTTQEALDACYHGCLDNGSCGSWAYDPDNYPHCQAYEQPTYAYFQSSTGSTERVWDVNCGEPVA